MKNSASRYRLSAAAAVELVKEAGLDGAEWQAPDVPALQQGEDREVLRFCMVI